MKKHIERFSENLKYIDIFTFKAFKIAIIIAVILNLLIVLFLKPFFNYYLEFDYYKYLVLVMIFMILLTPFTSLLTFCLFILNTLLIELACYCRDIYLSEEDKDDLIKSTIEKYNFKVFSAKLISKYSMLPLKTVRNVLNLMVVNREVDITINEKGVIIYTLNPNIDKLVGKMLKRIFDAN